MKYLIHFVCSNLKHNSDFHQKITRPYGTPQNTRTKVLLLNKSVHTFYSLFYLAIETQKCILPYEHIVYFILITIILKKLFNFTGYLYFWDKETHRGKFCNKKKGILKFIYNCLFLYIHFRPKV